MRILIDGRKINDGGIGVYIQNLVRGLVSLGEDSVAVLTSVEAFERFDGKNNNPFNSIQYIFDEAKPYSFDEFLRLPGRLDFEQFDLFHEPHFTLPYGVPIPTVVTVHDLIHITHPERVFYPYIARPMIRSALMRASQVICVSEATRREVSTFTNRAESVLNRVSVVPNAIDPYFLGRDLSELKEKHGKSRFGGSPYLMALFSNLKPHKGFQDLLVAFEMLKRRAGDSRLDSSLRKTIADTKLVLAGQGTEGMAEKNHLLNRAGDIEDVYILGPVPQETLRSLYAGAEALVVPSLTEGFYLPVIEAQALGTRIISRPVGAIEEILLPGDYRASGFDISHLVDALMAFLQDKASLKDGVQENRSLHLDRFRLSHVTNQVRDVYLQALTMEQREVAA